MPYNPAEEDGAIKFYNEVEKKVDEEMEIERRAVELVNPKP